MSRSRPIVKDAPPVAQRPLCVGCGRPLAPDYVEVYADDLDGPDVWGTWSENRDRARARVWRGHWKGWGATVDGIPTHCAVTCAAQHGTRLARLFLESIRDDGRGAIVLKDDGHRRFTANRPDRRHVNAALDILATDENAND